MGLTAPRGFQGPEYAGFFLAPSTGSRVARLEGGSKVCVYYGRCKRCLLCSVLGNFLVM
jgi:Zn-dependent alcohol dehydrogenase